MINVKQLPSEQSLGRKALDLIQDAISPDWLMKVIQITSLVLIFIIVLAFTM